LPYEEGKIPLDEFAKKKAQEAEANPTKMNLEWDCEQCKKKFKYGFDEEKQKDVPQNPDGSRHQKFKFPPKEVNGKKIWEWTCTSSKDDWAKKDSWKKSEYNKPIEIKKPDTMSNLESQVFDKLVQDAENETDANIPLLLGVIQSCKKHNIDANMTIGMLFKVLSIFRSAPLE